MMVQRFSMPYNPYTIAAWLKKHGVPVISVADWQDHEDGEIQINDKYHLQVGEYYLNLNWWTDDEQETITGEEITQQQLVPRILELI